MAQKWIERREGGGLFAIKLITWLTRNLGRTFARLILYPVTAYFFIRRKPERHASREFFRHLTGKSGTPRQVLKHMHTFSQCTLDRIFFVGGQLERFDVHIHHRDRLNAARALDRGVLIFGSHLGSYEALRVMTTLRDDVVFRTVFDMGTNPSVARVLEALNPRLASHIIDARQDGFSTALAIKEAVDQKAIVTMLVDRARPDNPTTLVDFLGAPAPFPLSPWLLAATLKVPVVLCFGLYRGGLRYDLHFEAFEDSVVLERGNREEAARRLVQRYADRLAHYTRMAPHNWFNFYDFWHTESAPPDVRAVADSDVVRRQH